jgi:uncharacterized membrane protein YhfC
MDVSDAEGYGVSLAFWENAILLGVLSLINLLVTYLLISQGLMPQSLYDNLVSANPGLFYSPQRLAVPIALGLLERISSFLVHFAWGFLCVLSAYLRKPVYLAIALPMGMVDALVPLAQVIPAWEFEAMLFALSFVLFLISRLVTRSVRRAPGLPPTPNA